MYAIVIHHMDDAGLMDDAKFLFFCYMMDKGDFSPLQTWINACLYYSADQWEIQNQLGNFQF